VKNLVLSFILLASSLLASEVNLQTPSTTLKSYYDAINEGDLLALKKIMTPQSYDTDIQIYALSIALKDKRFHQQLKQYNSSAQAKKNVEQAVKKKLKKRNTRTIVIKSERKLGPNRVAVKFTEDSKNRQLYFSHHMNIWQLDYLAGRTIK